MGKESPFENEQTHEQIVASLHEAREKQLFVDVDIEQADGVERTPDLLVDEITDEVVSFLFLDEDGEVEGSQECLMSRIKGVRTGRPYEPSND